MKNFKLLLCATASSMEDYSADCDYAVIDFDAELYQDITRRAELLAKLKETDDDVWKLSAWNVSTVYYSYDNLIEAGLEEYLDKLTDDGGPYIALPDEAVQKLKRADDQRTEVDQMVIRLAFSDGATVNWTCSPKHTDIYIETPEIPVKKLKEFLP